MQLNTTLIQRDPQLKYSAETNTFSGVDLLVPHSTHWFLLPTCKSLPCTLVTLRSTGRITECYGGAGDLYPQSSRIERKILELVSLLEQPVNNFKKLTEKVVRYNYICACGHTTEFTAPCTILTFTSGYRHLDLLHLTLNIHGQCFETLLSGSKSWVFNWSGHST